MTKKNELLFGIEPVEVMSAFALISEIDRGSGREYHLAEKIVEIALRHDYAVKMDDSNNVVVYLPATLGCENYPSLCLQSHLDMVSIGQDGKNFDTSTIEFVIDEGMLRANNTTLGADNGIGVAIMISLMGKEFVHGSLELLFTSDEESGLNGTKVLNPDWIKSQFLISLDSENWGEITVGCTGAGHSTTKIPIDLAPASRVSERDLVCPQFTIEVSNLVGGHSGLDIHKSRANAIVVLTEILSELVVKFPTLRILSIEGGGIFKQIPAQSRATLIIQNGDSSQWDGIQKVVGRASKWIKSYFSEETEAIISVNDLQTVKVDAFLSEEFSNKLLKLLLSLPNGVISTDFKNHSFVKTSNNIATINLIDGHVLIEMMYRSSSINELRKIRVQTMSIVSDAFGLYPKLDNEYPAWQPKYDSLLLGLAEGIFKKMFDTQLKRIILHGGLECAYFAEKWPDMQMISVGPTIRNFHSQKECAELNTIAPLYNWLLAIMAGIQQIQTE